MSEKLFLTHFSESPTPFFGQIDRAEVTGLEAVHLLIRPISKLIAQGRCLSSYSNDTLNEFQKVPNVQGEETKENKKQRQIC